MPLPLAIAATTHGMACQALLVAFCFGALIEGIAGFGAPVAITAAMLAGLGFEAVTAAVLAPILGSDVQTTTRALSAMVGRQLPFFSLLIPAYLVTLFAGWRRMLEVWPAGLPVSALGRVFAQTLRQLRLPVMTIAFILSIATVMNYSGMTSSMALALARTGWWFPFFSAWLGMIGVVLTGSDNRPPRGHRPVPSMQGGKLGVSLPPSTRHRSRVVA